MKLMQVYVKFYTVFDMGKKDLTSNSITQQVKANSPKCKIEILVPCRYQL